MEAVRERWTDDRMDDQRFDRLQNMILTGFATLLILMLIAQIG